MMAPFDPTEDPRVARLRMLSEEFDPAFGGMGSTGKTGLASNDAQGWSDMQNRKLEYQSLRGLKIAANPGVRF